MKDLHPRRLNLSIHGNDKNTGKNAGVRYNVSPEEPATASRPKRAKPVKNKQGKK